MHITTPQSTPCDSINGSFSRSNSPSIPTLRHTKTYWNCNEYAIEMQLACRTCYTIKYIYDASFPLTFVHIPSGCSTNSAILQPVNLPFICIYGFVFVCLHRQMLNHFARARWVYKIACIQGLALPNTSIFGYFVRKTVCGCWLCGALHEPCN